MIEKTIYYRVVPVTPVTDFRSLVVRTESPCTFFDVRRAIQHFEGIDGGVYSLRITDAQSGQIIHPPMMFQLVTQHEPQFDIELTPWPPEYTPRIIARLTYPFGHIIP